MLGLLLALALFSLAYLHAVGFPDVLTRLVIDQLLRRGVAAQFGTIRLDLFRGVVANNAVFADAKAAELPVIRIDELQLVWNWRRLARRENALDSIRIANAVVTMPTPPDEIGPEEFRAESAYATFKFEDDGTIAIDRLTGLYCGIRLYVTGRVKPAAASTRPTSKPEASPEQKRRQRQFITRIVRELTRVRVTEPPQLDVDLDVDSARPLAGHAKARLSGTDLTWRGLHVDSAAVNVKMQDGAIDLNRLALELYGGEVSLTGRYDFARGQFDLQLNSSTDPTAFAAILPADAAATLHELHVHENPKIALRLFLSPETGSVPQIQGSVEAGALEFRGVPFQSIRCSVEMQGPELKFHDAAFVMDDGRLLAQGRYDAVKREFAYEIDSTIDPTKLIPLLWPKPLQFVEQMWFDTPPHVVATVSGDFVDPDAFAYDAQITAQRCAFRGVLLEGASATLRLRRSQLDARDLVLARDEGQLIGGLLADFNRGCVMFDIDTTANPTEMAPLLGPKAGEVMQTYRFGANTRAHAAGFVDLAEPSQTAWTAQVNNDGFSWWKFTATHAQAELVFVDDGLRINNLDADLYDGKLQGNAQFEFANPDVRYHCEFSTERCGLKEFLTAMSGTTAKPTGFLSGHCELTGLGSDLATLEGTGNLHIADGVLWEGALFGIFSQILGNTKATDARATLRIADRTVTTDDLTLAAGAFTARAHGKVGFDGKLDFRIEAQFLSNWLGIGWLGRILGQILEYKVGGTISDPSYRPVNLPKELLPHE